MLHEWYKVIFHCYSSIRLQKDTTFPYLRQFGLKVLSLSTSFTMVYSQLFVTDEEQQNALRRAQQDRKSFGEPVMVGQLPEAR